MQLHLEIRTFKEVRSLNESGPNPIWLEEIWTHKETSGELMENRSCDNTRRSHHLQTKEGSLRRNQTSWHRDLRFLASRPVRNKFLTKSVVTYYGSPSKLSTNVYSRIQQITPTSHIVFCHGCHEIIECHIWKDLETHLLTSWVSTIKFFT